MRRIITIFLTVALSFQVLFAKNDEVDFVQLAALLLKDGYADRAYEALEQVDLNSSTIDKPYFYMLKGLTLTKKGEYKNANEQFYKSIELNKDINATKPIYLYIAQNSFQLKDYSETLKALDKVPEIVETKPKLQSLKAECFWKLDKKNEAFNTLDHLLQKYPSYISAYKQRFYYFIALQLYQSALEDADSYLKKAKPNETIMLNFINALRKSGQIDRAIELAEKAKINYNYSAKIIVILAHLYIDKGMIHSAADLFNQASVYDPKYTKEAAEIYRRAKDYVMALMKNAQMLNTKEKYKQRIAIFLEFGDFERVIASRSALERNGLLDDENMRYALAYAYYMEGEFDKTEELLSTLTKPELFKKATELRVKIEQCKENIWECDL